MRRNWLVAAIVVGVAAAVAVAVLVTQLRDGDDGRIATNAWVESACASLVEWQSAITSLADVSGGTLTPESIRGKLEDAVGATSQLTTDLRELGTPDLESGDRVKQQLDASASELESSFQALREGAESAAQAESPTDFLQALAKLAPQFQALLELISATVEDLRGSDIPAGAREELEQAIADAPACQALRGNG